MSYTPPTIKVTPKGGSTYTMSAVTYANMSAGRQYVTDNWMPRVFSFEFIPDSTSYLPKVTDEVKVLDPSNNWYFYGFVTESERVYDIPYNAATGKSPGDRVRVTAQGPMGQAGQTYVKWTQGPAITAQSFQGDVIVTNGGISLIAFGSYTYNPILNPTGTTLTFEGYVLDFMNQMAPTTTYIYRDFYDRIAYSAPFVDTEYATFTDTGSGGFAYGQIEFASSSRNQFNQIVISQQTGTNQTATNAGVTVKNAWNPQTFYANADSTAASLASYYLSTLNPAVPPPTKISSGSVYPNTANLEKLLLQYLNTFGTPDVKSIGYMVKIILRGVTYYAVIQGLSASWYPDRYVCDFYLMPTLGAPFTLDSTTNGVLNTNVLGLP